MRVIRHVADVAPAGRPRVVAAGRFDGVHRGHQRVLARVLERARAVAGESVVVLARGSSGASRLTDVRRRLELLGEVGVEAVVFAPAAALEAAVERLSAAVRVAAQGRGSAAPAGGTLDEIAAVSVCGAPITAASIGAALTRGDLAAARAMLGRDPGVAGRVVHGFHRGAALGIPTANLRVRGIVLPPDGVYVVRARVAGTALCGVANVGFNPTFGNRTRTVETHLLDFAGDLYGRRLEIAFLAYLRGERKFQDVAALVAQVRADIAAARRLLEGHGG